MNWRCPPHLLAALGLLLGGCSSEPEQGKKELPRVTVTQVQVKPLDDLEYFTGRTVAVESVDIRARVTGYLKEVKFKAGEEVVKGAPLYQIDPAPYQAEFDKAGAQEKQNETLLKEILNPKYTRSLGLYRGGTISPEEFEKIAGEKLQAEFALTAAQKAKDRLKINLDWCLVTAPISGRISNTSVTEGNLVSADVTVLTNIVSVEPMYCYADVDENTLLAILRRIRSGNFKTFNDAKVPVYLGLSEDRKGDVQVYPHKGYLDFTDNRVDPATGTLKVRAVFDNPPVQGIRVLTPGLFARLKVPIGQRDKALWVPDRAVVTEQGKKFLYVVNDKSIVEARPVFLLKLEDGMRAIEPIMVVRTNEGSWRPVADNEKGVGEDSLKAGETVIVSGLQRVRPGVQVVTADPAKK